MAAVNYSEAVASGSRRQTKLSRVMCWRRTPGGKGTRRKLSAMVEVARGLDVRRLYALCHPEHRASWRVLEKCGFVRDRTWSRQVEFPNLAAGVPQDVACYEMLFAARSSHEADR